jgi:hypothetical protein
MQFPNHSIILISIIFSTYINPTHQATKCEEIKLLNYNGVVKYGQLDIEITSGSFLSYIFYGAEEKILKELPFIPTIIYF